MGGASIPIKGYSRRVEDGGTVELFVQDILGAPEVVPQCSIKPVPLGRKQWSKVALYIEPFILPAECPGKRNKLNIEAFQSGKYPHSAQFVRSRQTKRAN